MFKTLIYNFICFVFFGQLGIDSVCWPDEKYREVFPLFQFLEKFV